MCGISGIWAPGREGDALRRTVSGMASRLSHRGPDGEGVWLDAEAGIALGHRRLSVLEMSSLGAQPMPSRDGRHVLTFNGEIYNHKDLRRAVGESLALWRGRSDTETLVEVLALSGFESALAQAHGMFAFAAWDRRERVLRLAVDRMGEKPLYYGIHEGAFVFASEPKAFAALSDWRPEISRESVSLMLRFGAIPAPHCIWEGFRKLEPGCFLEVCLEDNGFSVRKGRYWDLPAVAATAAADRFRGDEREAADELERRLRAVISRQRVADAPLGAFLSGGIDSSTIAALLQEQSDSPAKTFTIGFDAPGYDETEHARLVAAHLGTVHVEERLTGRAALELVPRLPEIWCEPFADASQLPTLLASRLARRHVTVCLSGDGGDELFAGYNRHILEARYGHLIDALSASLRGTLASGIRRGFPGEKSGKIAAALEASGPEGRQRALRTLWSDPAALLPGLRETANPVDPVRRWNGLDPFERVQLLDMLTYLPDDILTKVDRAAMAFGLETRAPFLDAELVAFAFSLPARFKVRGGVGKQVLRRVLARHVPPALFERPKAGFSVPIAAWLRGPLRDWAESLLEPSRLRDGAGLEPGPIRTAWDEHLAGRSDHGTRLWAVLMFQAWRERQTHVA